MNQPPPDNFADQPANEPEFLTRAENLRKLQSLTEEMERLRKFIDDTDPQPPRE